MTPEVVLRALERVRESGKTNMYNRKGVLAWMLPNERMVMALHCRDREAYIQALLDLGRRIEASTPIPNLRDKRITSYMMGAWDHEDSFGRDASDGTATRTVTRMWSARPSPG